MIYQSFYTCLQNNPEIYPSCPTPGDPPNGTDLGEKFYSDIEYAKSVLRDWPGFSAHVKCLCESKCGQYLKEVWPGNANDRLCNLNLDDIRVTVKFQPQNKNE